MSKAAIFPGSFDPITLGHTDIIHRTLPLFDKLIIAVGENTHKNYHFTLAQRLDLIKNIYKNNPKIQVLSYEGLTVDFCKKMNIKVLVRGLRNPDDFKFEQPIAQVNEELAGVATLFLSSQPQYGHISSSLVRELLKNGHSAEKYRP